MTTEGRVECVRTLGHNCNTQPVFIMLQHESGARIYLCKPAPTHKFTAALLNYRNGKLIYHRDVKLKDLIEFNLPERMPDNQESALLR